MMIKKLIKFEYLTYLIFVLLFILPFFWFKPGELDLGGDSSRLYFYDPLAFLKNVSWYGVSSQGSEPVEPNYYYIPFISAIFFIKTVFNSSWFTLSLFNSIKLSFAFLGIYLLLKEILSKRIKKRDTVELVSLITGLFYVFSPRLIDTWDKALTSHNQIFINPVSFYLIFKFLSTNNKKYAIGFLFLSFIFSPSFSLTSAPPFFAFFPISLIFILAYTRLILKIKIEIKNLISFIICFILLQLFHLLPQIFNLLTPGSFSNVRVFDKESIAQEGIRYFISVLPYAKASENLLLLLPNKSLNILTFIIPLVILLGLQLSKKTDKLILLIATFFLATFFLLTANITEFGKFLYTNLFYIPGFTMFRNFIGQWLFVYIFFYTLLFGVSLAYVFQKLSTNVTRLISVIFILLLILQATPFINGNLLKKYHPTSSNVSIPIEIDNDYKIFLNHLEVSDLDGKILSLPFTDSYYQVLAGKNGGAYIGQSPLSLLTKMSDFYGYQIFPSNYSEEFLRQARNKDYVKIKEILMLFGINYIFHNSDPRIYDANFPESPYSYVRISLPKNQNEYISFISKLDAKRIYNIGNYALYKLEDTNKQNLIFYANNIISYEDKVASQPGVPFFDHTIEKNTVYITQNDCKKIACTTLTQNFGKSEVTYKKISPTEYQLFINTLSPSMLVFLNSYDKNWKIVAKSDDNSLIGKFKEKIIADKTHISVNEYANGWLISKEDLESIKGRRVVLEMRGQNIFYLSFSVSLICLLVLIVYSIKNRIFTKRLGIIDSENDKK